MKKEDFIQVIKCKNNNGCIPGWYNYLAKETREKYGEAINELCAKYPDDFLMFEPDDCEFPFGDESACRDIWGTKIMKSPDGVGINVKAPALDDWSDLDAYLSMTPDPYRAGRFDACDAYCVETVNDDRYRLGVFWLSFFERLHMIRGMDKLFMDFYTNPDELKQLMQVVKEYLLETINAFAERNMDGIILGEDWGMQDRLMISPDMWREWFKPHYADIFEHIHNKGMHAWMHSCGHIDPIIGDLVELGLDVLHPLQYGCVNWQKTAELYGGKICFLGAIDVARIMVEKTPAEVRAHVDAVVTALNRDGGGLILAPANTIMPESPLENIRALFEQMDLYCQ